MPNQNIRTCINILRRAKSIDDLVMVQNILKQENIMNQNLEFAVRAFAQGNKQAMTQFIFGPSNLGSGRGLVADLEELAKSRGV